MALLSPKAALLPSYIGNRPGLRPSIIAMLVLSGGLKTDMGTGNFFCGFVPASEAELCFRIGGCSGRSLRAVEGVSHYATKSIEALLQGHGDC